jgi:hypothetical protein
MEKFTVANMVFEFLAHVTNGMSASITGIVEPVCQACPEAAFKKLGYSGGLDIFSCCSYRICEMILPPTISARFS